MAVYTEVTPAQVQELMDQLQLGAVHQLTPCSGGIENTNYFVDTAQGSYVLTLFERLSFEELPFYLRLMEHLADRDIPVPKPFATPDGEILHRVCDKPAAVVVKLKGRQVLNPSPAHCAEVSTHMARMHLAGQDFAMQQPNLRGREWWNATIPTVLPHLDEAQQALILSEQAHQNDVAASSAYAALPRGAVHADLFRDNAMFDGCVLSGFFDFYFAGTDAFVFDIAVVLNDWCFDHEHAPEATQDLPEHIDAFMRAYEAVRTLTDAERQLLPDMRRAAALRFWTSRLWDFYMPREASVLTPHDPTHFERILTMLRTQ